MWSFVASRSRCCCCRFNIANYIPSAFIPSAFPSPCYHPHTHTILSLIHLRETVRDLNSRVINYCLDRYRPLIWLRDSSPRICYTLISFWVGSLSRAFRLNQSNANLFIKARTGLLDRWTRFIVIKHEIF